MNTPIHYGLDLCKELTKFPCKNYEDFLAKAWAQIRWDEDKEYKMSIDFPIKTTRELPNIPNRNDNKQFRQRRSSERDYDSYTNGNHYMENWSDMRSSRKPYDRRNRAQERSRLLEYNLNIEPVKLVGVLKGIGEVVKWPQKMKALPGIQDTRKWCEFHQDHSHRTDECHALQLEVAELLKQGHLKDLLTERGRATRDKGSNRMKDDAPLEPLRQDRVINLISGGFEVNRVLYTVAKRSSHHTFRIDVHKTEHMTQKLSRLSTSAQTSQTTKTTRTTMHWEMGLKEEDITRRCISLVGFSGESRTTIGEIVLPVYAERVNLYTKFLIPDRPSAYNIILGRP